MGLQGEGERWPTEESICSFQGRGKEGVGKWGGGRSIGRVVGHPNLQFHGMYESHNNEFICTSAKYGFCNVYFGPHRYERQVKWCKPNYIFVFYFSKSKRQRNTYKSVFDPHDVSHSVMRQTERSFTTDTENESKLL